MRMSSRTQNRQVFIVENDDPIDDYTRKPSQEEFLPRKSRMSGRMSVKDFPPFKDDFQAAKAPFHKTPKGIAIIAVCSVVCGLIVLGGFIGLTYYLGVSLNTRRINEVNTGLADPSNLDSTIMTFSEKSNLINIGSFKSFSLLYRATRDGFFMNIFHRLCDNRVQTVSVIRSHMNSVFGGYTAQTWNGNGYKTDTTAFLFSLRRRGVTNSERFNVTSSSWAIYAQTSFGKLVESKLNFKYFLFKLRSDLWQWI
jgi:hypothetical protein